jgi:hypothetical protein
VSVGFSECVQESFANVVGQAVDFTLAERARRRDREAHLREVFTARRARREMGFDQRNALIGQRTLDVGGHVFDELATRVSGGAHRVLSLP